MSNFNKLLSVVLSLLIMLSICACGEFETGSDVVSEISSENKKTVVSSDENGAPIMSSDRVMSKYFDISLFDEENYADIYLGKKFKIDSEYIGKDFKVPATIDDMKKIGFDLCEGNTYDENSLVFSYETIETVLKDKNGVSVKAWFYNSSKSSKKLKECNIVKFLITNDFYKNAKKHTEFNVNGITNTMAITDVINTLGTPSHFYAVSKNLYYLDYFISEDDRRNGITVYINPVEDNIVSIEFSYYK